MLASNCCVRGAGQAGAGLARSVVFAEEQCLCTHAHVGFSSPGIRSQLTGDASGAGRSLPFTFAAGFAVGHPEQAGSPTPGERR